MSAAASAVSVSSCALVLALACAACGAADGPGPSTKSGKTSGDPSNGGFGANNGDGATNNGGNDTSPGQPSEVWGHSADTLYKLDPTTKAVSVVGPFKGCSGDVLDIALDADSHLFATTADALWTVDKSNASCTKIASGTYPNSLSFVPKGTVDANSEALVGYDRGTYVRIDTKTGQKTNIGSIGDGLESSGDIVSVKDGATFLTVTGGASCSATDCLIEVNPTTGALVKNWGSIGRSEVYGLAFWAGKVYGFDAAGELFEVSFDGEALTTRAIDVPSSTTNLAFWGAGSTTSAPVTGPK